MRNDSNDDLDRVPSLTVRESDRPYPAPEFDPVPREPDGRRGRDRRRRGGTGLLWVLVVALGIALAGLGWWASRQISLLEAQLVATQDSFARISEDAAGRLSAITGQVVAAESTVTSESEALKLRLAQLERGAAEATRQQQLFSSQQETLRDQQAGLGRRLEEQGARLDEQGKRLADQGQRLEGVSTSLQSQQVALDTLNRRAETVAAEQAKVSDAVAAQADLKASVEALQRDVASLKDQPAAGQALARLEQEVLVLRSELDAQPDAPISSREFDAFRAQMARNINTLQSQVANLQSQLDARQ